MALTLITPPASEPVTLAEVRLQCNLAADDTSHDDRLNLNVAAATDLVERHSRRSLITQTWRLDTHPRVKIELPRAPLQSVTSVEVLGSDGSTYTTISATDYQVSAKTDPGMVWMHGSWPDWYEYEEEPVRITYVAGYGAAGDVPVALRLAVLQLTCFFFEYTGDAVDIDLPMHFKAMLRGLSSGASSGYWRGAL